MPSFEASGVDVLLALGRNIGLLALAAVIYAVLVRKVGRTGSAGWSANAGGQAAYATLFTATALLAMAAPFTAAPGILVDTRAVPLGLAGLFGGPLAGALTGLAVAAYRLSLGGSGAVPGAVGVLLSAGAGIAVALLLRRWRQPLRLRHVFVLAAVLGPLHLSSAFVLTDWSLAFAVLERTGLAALLVDTLGTAFLGTLLMHELWRHQGELALRDSEMRYRLLAENVGDVLTRVRPDGVRTFCSEAARDVLGYEPDALVGRPSTELIHPDDLGTLATAMAGLTPRTPTVPCLTRMRHGAGHWIWVEASVRLIADPTDGRVIEYIAVSRDVTRRILMEREAREAREEAERANRSKSTFVAGLSHELLTPLNAIIGFTDAIAQESLGPISDQRYLQLALDARDSGQHLLELINDVLDHAKAESGRLSLSEDMVDLDAAVSFCARMISPRACRAGVELSRNVAADTRYIRADEMRVRQILLNLLANAVKYTPSGGRVTVTAALRNGQPTIVVTDTGIGADRGARQPPANDDRAIEEAGFGLPLTRRLVELHGGSLTIASLVREGTVATVRLPAERHAEAPAPSTSVTGPPTATVLLVEDDPLIRFATAELLDSFGHAVLQAGNANEALAVLRGDRSIDLLFTDIVMPPGMNGAELAREAERLRPGIKVLLTSGFAGHAVVGEDGMGKGYEMLPKPFAPTDVKRKLDAMLAFPAASTASA